jgi:hypothetical protein
VSLAPGFPSPPPPHARSLLRCPGGGRPKGPVRRLTSRARRPLRRRHGAPGRHGTKRRGGVGGESPPRDRTSPRDLAPAHLARRPSSPTPAGRAPMPARPLTHSAVRRRPVPAAAARRAAGDGRPVPHGPAASIHSRGGLRSAAATLGTGPASTPAPAAATPLASVQLNDVVQRHVHFVGHGGRGIGPRLEPARQHAGASLPAPRAVFRRRGPGAEADWPRSARGANWRVRAGPRTRRALLRRRRPRCGRFCTFPRGRRRRQRKGGAARD